MGDDRKERPFRYTKGKLSVETTLLIIFAGWMWRTTTWGFRRFKPMLYHPIALAGTITAMLAYLASPWALAATLWALVVWPVAHPTSYLRHGHTRTSSFLAGFRYRHRPRKKLKANGLINDEDPTPTVSHVHKIGCTTKVRIKMSYGDEINYWRERSARLAQTYGALDCKIDPYRRNNYLTLRPEGFTSRPPFIRYHFTEKVTKPRWLQLEFLTKDPFTSRLGVEYIDYHQAETLSPVVATYRTAETHSDNLASHRLRVAMTRWGKSNANRADIYAQRHNLAAGLLEIWLIDGKGGVEGAFLEHQIARHAYGDVETNPGKYDPAEFDRLLKDAVSVMLKRQRKMRGFATEHIPTPTEPWLRIKIDEILVLTSKSVPPELRTSIAASINLIQQQGIACGVSLDASTQLGKKDKLDPIDRDGFTEFEIGRVERGVVDMIFGNGWWERGARCDEIPEDLKGVFYRKTETTMAPQEIRYPRVTDADLRTLQPVGGSVLWKPDKPRGIPAVA